MLWLAIHFPDLPIDLWTPNPGPGCTDDAAPATPLAIIEQRRICRANAAARAHGIHPGLSAATAAALCAGLVLRERRREQEQRRLAQLAQRALAFTPHTCIDDGIDAGTRNVSVDAPTLLLEIGGCLRLFRGLDALLARIAARFADEAVTHRLALAPTPVAARLFAVNGIDSRAFYDDDGHADDIARQAALAALPIRGLGLDTRTEESLMQTGLRQFSDIDALPRQALGRRFGSGFIDWLDRVTGARPDPRAPVAPATFYVREVNFLDGIVHREGLVFPMQRLLGDFAQFLRRQQFATQQFAWRLTHVDGSTQDIVLNTTRPETAPAQMLALTRVRLETTRLPAPVETLRLACRRFVPLAAPDRLGQLFPPAGGVQHAAGIHTLVDRLRARLGDDHCRQFVTVDTWKPEAAQRAVAATVDGTSRKLPVVRLREPAGDDPGQPPAMHIAPMQMPSPQGRRPLWLLREPARIHRQDARLHWHGTLEIVDGPERLDSDWWAQPLQRDYFVAYHEGGTLCWIFHDCAQDAWFVHGVFG